MDCLHVTWHVVRILLFKRLSTWLFIFTSSNFTHHYYHLIHHTIKLSYSGNMSKGKRVTFKEDADDRQWSIKALREVIFPEIYERYGPNAEPNMQLPYEILEDLRRQVYGEASSSVKQNVPHCKTIRGKSASNVEPTKHGKK